MMAVARDACDIVFTCGWVYVLNCRNVPPLAYNSPLAYPQSAGTVLPMEYGQGLYHIHDVFMKWNMLHLTCVAVEKSKKLSVGIVCF